ncbi:MAG TPA: hypothetical protein VMT57_08045 [Candidatus Thermoplasmatota archaeon]|nr:hypothetical protein [Candidatus Thermoplasmatota archaeon]
MKTMMKVSGDNTGDCSARLGGGAYPGANILYSPLFGRPVEPVDLDR